MKKYHRFSSDIHELNHFPAIFFATRTQDYASLTAVTRNTYSEINSTPRTIGLSPYSQHLPKKVPKLYVQTEVVRQPHTKTEIRLCLASNSALVLKRHIKFLAIVS